MKLAYLVLENKEVFEADSLNFIEGCGEVVFNTSHSGYEEIATDPSYFNQIVVMTSPMQGNYGSHPEQWESDKIYIKGFICLKMQNSDRDKHFLNQLSQSQVGVFENIDTRQLVFKLREWGTVLGAMVLASSKQEAIEKSLIQFEKYKNQNQDVDWVYKVSTPEIMIEPGENTSGPKVVVIDFGSKKNILKEVKKLSSEVVIVPSRTPYESILSYQPKAIILTNGPGDPADVKMVTQTLSHLIGQVPIFGVCMGHQILALALGGKTYKLKFGHRGANHPIEDLILKKIYVASHNHGYAVAKESLPQGVQVTHINLNDQTVAGIYNKEKKYLSVQFHPESCPGPHEARQLFEYFFKEMVT